MNLREQFLKSGLINKKQADKLAAEKKRQEHLLKKDKSLFLSAEAEKQNAQQELANEFELQRQRDKELNKQRDAILAQREKIFRARQIINSNAQNQRSAQEFYYFLECDKFVRKVLVTSWQREMLARGSLAIVRLDDNVDEFIILNRDIAKILLDICPEKIIVLHSEIGNLDEIFSANEDLGIREKGISNEQSTQSV